VWQTVGMRRSSFWKQHSLSIVTIGIVLLWAVLYMVSDPAKHAGSFFGNAIADWTGVLVTVIATKYFFEVGSAESRRPPRGEAGSRVRHLLRNHSLSIFLTLTGIGWLVLFLHMNPEGKWGQVVGNVVSEWTQLLGLVLMTKRLIEPRSKESRAD
jgi:hypothetical protein